jgi:hypothetical protein
MSSSHQSSSNGMHRSPSFNVSNLQQYNQLMAATAPQSQPTTTTSVKKSPSQKLSPERSQPIAAPSLSRSSTSAYISVGVTPKVARPPTRANLTPQAPQSASKPGFPFNLYQNEAPSASTSILSSRTPSLPAFNVSFGNQTPDITRSAQSVLYGQNGNNRLTPSSVAQAYKSEIEAQILNAQQQPAQLSNNETDEISVNGERGIYANKSEVANWRGQIPIEQYEINKDCNPEIITKRPTQAVDVCIYVSIFISVQRY